MKVNDDDDNCDEDDNDIFKGDFLMCNHDEGSCMGCNTLFIHFVLKLCLADTSLLLNSSPIDELWNWCHLNCYVSHSINKVATTTTTTTTTRLVGAPCEYQAQQGGSMATL